VAWHPSLRLKPKLFAIVAVWSAVVVFFAIQWFTYDAARGNADAFRHYLWWSFYTWGMLTPVVVRFAYRNPINSSTWKRALPLHLGVSFVLVAGEISVEALIGRFHMHHDLSMSGALRHYFTRHAQASVLTYWMLVGAVQLYRMRDQSREHQLRSSKLEVQLVAAQLEVLRAQIHPHFLFNTLQAATTLIHDDPEGAEDVLLRLSELLRASLECPPTQEIPLRRELELLDLYIGIQSRRFGDRLHFEVVADEDVCDCMVPALILQPLVENAVKHGVGVYKGADTISIRSFRQGEFLRLEVRNRNSRLTENQSRSQGNGVGLANTRARLQQLYGNRQELRMQELSPAGVCAEISIPLCSLPASPEEPAP
jgi:two-component system, LytTR family, sensor kinase